MNFRHIALLGALSTFLLLAGHSRAEDVPAAGDASAPSAPASEAANPTTPNQPNATGESRPKQAKRSSRRSGSMRHARRRGAGPQDRSEHAKRHQAKMMQQSARRHGAVSRHTTRPKKAVPVTTPTPAPAEATPPASQ